MASDKPRVSIGIPVYNGAEHISQALDSLLAQDFANVELVISDNASTDQTRQICEAYVERYPHVRYFRSDTNIGQMPNFRRALELASGEYFMWAAHDDTWSPTYISSLAGCLDAPSRPVLATAKTVFRTQEGDSTDNPDDPCAPGGAPFENLESLLTHRSASWIYGLFRRDWLVEHVHELEWYPVWGGDMLWLSGICLRFPVAGSADAVIYKRMGYHSQTPTTARQILRFYFGMMRRYAGISIRYGRGPTQKLRALSLSWKHFYRGYIQPRGARGMARLFYSALGFRLISAESPLRRLYTRKLKSER